MLDKAKLETREVLASQFVEDFLALQLHMSQMPPEMTEARNLIDEMRLRKSYKRNNVFIIISRMMDLMYPDNKPTMGELSRAMALPLSTTTNVIDFLVKNKYCKRLSDRSDRRIVRIALTDVGRRNLEIGDKYIEQRGQEILSALTAKEQTTFLTLLNKIAKTIVNSELSP
jgi:DNA-binding MarR family transcriptional regulator